MTHCSNRSRSLFLGLFLLAMLAAPARLPAGGPPPSPPSPPSTTSLSTSTASAPVGTAITLTATVTAANVAVTPGLVTFCDATAAFCQGPSLLGTAQLTAAGTASIKVVLGPGAHSVKAVFVGKAGTLGSVSSAAAITVTGSLGTSTTIASSGSAGAYTLTAEVAYHGLFLPGANETTGFFDTSNSEYLLGTATLSSLGPATYGFITIPTSPFAAGGFPSAEVSGDFNGDGISELAVVNYTDDTVSVFAGDGGGGFTPISGSPFAVGAGPTALAVADVNNDGLPDILSVNAKAGTVSILLADGSGGFTLLGSPATGSGPQAIAVGDFNSDGNIDLAIANLLDSTLTILLGDGTGHFTNAPAVNAYTGNNPNGIVSADFNGDGITDLAVANLSDGTITVLLGDGTGSFTAMPGSPFPAEPYPSALAVGDFNGDGRPDLAVGDGTKNKVAILLNTGNGFSASPGSPFATGLGPSAIAVGEVNGDGIEDLVIANAGDNTSSILLGDGKGAFSPSAQSPLGGFDAPGPVVLGDFNGDGTEDLAVANVGAGKISIRPLQISQTATATLSPAIAIPGPGIHLVDTAFAGDSSYSGSTSPTVSLTGSKIATTALLDVSPATTVQYLQTLQLTGTVVNGRTANYVATGTGTFADGAAMVGSAAVAKGEAVASVNSLGVGPHSLTFSYPGDINFISSVSNATAVIVTKASTATVVTSSSLASVPGAPIAFTATVTPATGGTPTGTVTFFSDGAQIGAGTLAGVAASFNTSALTAGTHTITATYSGDGNYTGSSSTLPIIETVSDFTLTATPAQQTVIPGRSVSYSVSISPANGAFGSAISLAVTGLPANAVASFSPATVIPGSSAASSALTVTAPVQRAALLHIAPVTFALLLLPFAGSRRLRRSRGMFCRALTRGLFGLLLLAAGTAIMGCGGNAGFFGQPPGSYTLTVTATSGGLSHSTTVTLNVE